MVEAVGDDHLPARADGHRSRVRVQSAARSLRLEFVQQRPVLVEPLHRAGRNVGDDHVGVFGDRESNGRHVRRRTSAVDREVVKQVESPVVHLDGTFCARHEESVEVVARDGVRLGERGERLLQSAVDGEHLDASVAAVRHRDVSAAAEDYNPRGTVELPSPLPSLAERHLQQAHAREHLYAVVHRVRNADVSGRGDRQSPGVQEFALPTASFPDAE